MTDDPWNTHLPSNPYIAAPDGAATPGAVSPDISAPSKKSAKRGRAPKEARPPKDARAGTQDGASRRGRAARKERAKAAAHSGDRDRPTPSDAVVPPRPSDPPRVTATPDPIAALGAPGGGGYFDRPPPVSPPEGRRPRGRHIQSRRRQPHPARTGRGPRRGRVVVPALVAGVGLALSLPPWGFWVLAFPAAGLLWWRLDGLRLRARLLAGWVAGLGLFVPGLFWATSFNTYGGVVLMVVEALAPALACACMTRHARGRTMALAGAMVLFEELRSIWPFGGLPLGGIALGQAAGPLAPVARLGGPLLLVAVVWLAGGGLARVVSALTAWARRGRGRVPVTALASGALSMAVVAGLSAWGALAPDGGPATHTVRVAAVQGGGSRGVSQSEVASTVVFNAQVAATKAIATHDGGRPPQLVLWPEDVVKLDGLIDHSPVEGQLGALAVSLHATLVVGVTETVSGQRFRNEIVAFSPQGTLVARYEKVHRVPFGEYVPYRSFFSHLASLSAVPLDAIPGHGSGLLRTPAGPLGAMVSYEVFFAERGWVATRAGAQLLVVPTNTSSYKTSQVPTQEVAAAQLQAIAEGRDLVQAAPTGFSAVIDNDGRVLARSVLGGRALVVRDVALRTGKTLYEQAGDVPVLILAGVLLLLGWVVSGPDASDGAPVRRRARGRRPAGAEHSGARRGTAPRQ